jgi:hypothetical protein
MDPELIRTISVFRCHGCWCAWCENGAGWFRFRVLKTKWEAIAALVDALDASGAPLVQSVKIQYARFQ